MRRLQQPLTDLSIRVPATAVEADLLSDRIERLWPKKPSTVSPDTPVREVLKKMVDRDDRLRDGRRRRELVGIFSERDALMKLNVDAAKFVDRPIGSS